ncbi:hypothetical protein M407DRAFT_18656 [Tulasnella calospora MUT 4182]|uniref:Homeobox domain-containing protein n=1 Tax=Tulasnella calospora MUT 4182 TaxID=1051891 RepID=A0A0C3QT93_9AGAM|nr:hypothetical protein M407DRAFT_18656 [Tulasnella calospora MUT 4182]
MGPPRSTPHSARLSRSPSPTSGPHLPLQTLINTPATTTTSTPQQGLAADLVVSGGPASVRDPRATAGSPQNPSQPGPLLQLSTAPPHPPPAPVASPTSTLPPSSFRFPPGRLTRAQSRSFNSLGTTTPPPDQRSQRDFGSTSSLDTTGSSSAIHIQSLGRGSHVSLPDVGLADLSVASGTSRSSRLAAQGVGRNAVADNRSHGMSDDEDEDEDEHYGYHGVAPASGASDADSEGSTRRRRSLAEHAHAGPRERLLLPTTELELFHAKKKRTRVLPTAHQSAELNKLLAETPFPSTARREELGRRIGLSARKVQVWFQNRRQKARREKEEAAMKQQSASTSTSVSGRPESPSLAPHSPRHGHARMAALPHPPSSWNPPLAPGAGINYPPRSEYTLQPAATHFGHLTPGSSPYQLRPVDVAPEPITEYGMVPVYRRHSPRAQSWSGGDPRDPALGPIPHLSFNREHQRSSTHAEAERFTSVERPYGRPASPPSSFHPYAASAEARRRRSPSRRIVQSRPPSPRGVPSRPTSPFDGPSTAASEALTQDVRLPPLNLPPGSPASPLLGLHEPRRSLDRVALSPPYPPSISHAGSASTSLDRRIGDAASQQQQLTPAVRPAEVAQSATHSTAYPPPFTLQPEPLWDRHAVPDYFQPRRLSWPSQIALRTSSVHPAPDPPAAQQPIRLPWPVSGPTEYVASLPPSRPSSPRARR